MDALKVSSVGYYYWWENLCGIQGVEYVNKKSRNSHRRAGTRIHLSLPLAVIFSATKLAPHATNFGDIAANYPPPS